MVSGDCLTGYEDELLVFNAVVSIHDANRSNMIRDDGGNKVQEQLLFCFYGKAKRANVGSLGSKTSSSNFGTGFWLTR